MKKKIAPSQIQGTLTPPPSKSYMQRAIAIAALAEGESTIGNPSYSADGLASMHIARQLGAFVVDEGKTVKVRGAQNLKSNVWDCGESGLSIRMFSAIAALQESPITLTGHGSMPKRSMQTISDTLLPTGVKVELAGDRIPVRISGGPLQAGKYELEASESSQPLTGLLIALASLDKDSVLTVKNLASKPYIDITLDILRDFGVDIEHKNYEEFLITGGQKLCGSNYKVEADWSGASFLCVAAAIGGRVLLRDISYESSQGDKAILDVIKQVGADVQELENSIIIKKDKLEAFDFDASDCPDLFPPLVALAVNCSGTSRIRGIHRLQHKESDRFLTLKEEFAKLGVAITRQSDEMIVPGTKCHGSVVNGRNDHRIAMALAVAGIQTDGYTLIEDWKCISKSYPNFFNDLSSIGGSVADVE